MERSSRVLQHGKPKIWIFFKTVRNWWNWILFPRVSVCREQKSPWLRQYQSYSSNWYVNGKVFTSTTTWEPKNLIFFLSKKFEIEFDLYFECAEELRSTFKSKNLLLFFSRKFEIDFWLVSKSWILLSFVNTSLTLVFTSTYYINGKVFTSTYFNMKRWKHIIIWFYSPKKFEIEFWLVFCLTCFFKVQNWILTCVKELKSFK